MEKSKYSQLFIEIHTADWCPDCVRELPVLELLINKLDLSPAQYKYFYYNDPEDYKLKKSNNVLDIQCVPTFVFKIDTKVLFKVEEVISNNLEDELNFSLEKYNSL